MEIINFFGRLHPLIVHLPIGFLLIAILLEGFRGRPESPDMHKAITFILFCGALSAIAAAVVGWLLANNGGYEEATLYWHRWSGIATIFLTVVAWWAKRKTIRKVYKYSLWSMGLLLLTTGHLGGSLTHGSEYLLKPFLGANNGIGLDLPTQTDSVIVYKHLIQPILEEKCYACHNVEKKQGGLDLTTWEKLSLGGENGKVMEGSVWKSEIFRRVTLPQDNKKFMPPKGNPLKYSEIVLLKWWIEEGADEKSAVAQYEIPEEIQNLLLRDYGLDTQSKPFVETVSLPPIPEEVLSRLLDRGWRIQALGETNHLLDVKPIISDLESKINVGDLLEIKEHITWLNLGKMGIMDKDLKFMAQFPNLSRLRLENNEITDAGLKYLIPLKHVESLNLYGNPISDLGLETLREMPALKNVFLWKTKVSSEAVEKSRNTRPELMLNTGS